MTLPIRILVFDSGVGGLSVLAALRQRIKGCELVYASDNAAFPYGAKSNDFLIERVERVLRGLIERVQPDIIVVACNTASTLVLPSIRANFTVPVVGVVPAIKPAAKLSHTRVIGLLGTPGTVNRDYTQQLISDFAADCDVIKVGSSRLVEIAEQSLRGTDPDPVELRTILAPMWANEQLDTVVLACTHFPLIAEQLAGASPRPLTWVDSGEAIARRVEALQQSIAQHTDTDTPGCDATQQAFDGVAIFTADTESVRCLMPALQTFSCHTLMFITV